MHKSFITFCLTRRKRLCAFAGTGILLLLCLMTITRVELTGNFEGIFLLKSADGRSLELKDDVFPDECRRLLFKVNLEPLYDYFHVAECEATSAVSLDYEWNEKAGRGFIRNYFPGGRKLLISFGRYIDDTTGLVPSGLFLGGGLPFFENESDEVKMNATGMAYFDGTEWHHVWCTENEAIGSHSTVLQPSQWKFLGSRVLKATDKELALMSRHEVTLDGVPLRIERYVLFRSGDSHFVLVNRVVNAGRSAVTYRYTYGDEPWVGDYGSSRGDVGWVEDGLVNYQGVIDAGKYSFAGMYDYGNGVIGEGHGFTGTANFIQWLGDLRPNLVYFTDRQGVVRSGGEKVPLASDTNRFLALEWGPRVLQPGESDVYTLAIGMALHDPKTGLPVKPQVAFDFPPQITAASLH